MEAELSFSGNKSTPAAQKMAAAGSMCIAFQAVMTLVTAAPQRNVTKDYGAWKWQSGAAACSQIEIITEHPWCIEI